jgi:uncharacterized membrane protein YfcA
VTTGQLIVVAVAVFGAAFVQAIAGFGFGLLAMPIMTLALPVEKAVVISTLLAVLSTTWQATTLRADARWPLVGRLTAGAFLVDDRLLKIVLGVAVLLSTLMLVRRINLSHVGHGFDLGSGFLSGVLNTSLSTNGPPLVFNLQARHLQAHEFRATIAMVFALSNIVSISLFLADGKVTRDGVRAALIAVPAWVIGQFLGRPIRQHLHGERFRWLVLGLLFAAGVSTIVFAVT